jgi:D-alanyl-D-alanine dipeptidase
MAGDMSSKAAALFLSLSLALAGCATAQGAAGSRTEAPAERARSCRLAPGSELVDVTKLDPTIRTEIRYATENNFTGRRLPGYDVPLALLRPGAAEALARVNRRLAGQGLALKVFDGYRPIRATQAMVTWANRTGNGWVLRQGYVASRSGHNRGATVDLTVVRLSDGGELDMGTPYDTFSEAAHTANATGQVRDNRAILLRAMEAEGWVNYEKEWWHFRLPGEHSALDYPLGCYR